MTKKYRPISENPFTKLKIVKVDFKKHSVCEVLERFEAEVQPGDDFELNTPQRLEMSGPTSGI